jgi:hypothetical protein
MQSKFSQKRSDNSLPSNAPISLIGSKWRCLEAASWDEKQHVFFAESADFCSFTMSRDARVKSRSMIINAGDWIIETDAGGMLARARLQIIQGDYRQGIILFDFDCCTFEDFPVITSQLLTSCFATQRLDLLKVMPMNDVSMNGCRTLLNSFERQLMTFRVGEHPEPTVCTQFHLERDAWLESESGVRALNQLGWLQKRIQRETKARQFAAREREAPWLFRLLTLGRRRRRRADTVHPLDLFRSRL